MSEEITKGFLISEDLKKAIEAIKFQDEWVASLLTPTPEQFIKSKTVGGGKKADYIEGAIAKGSILEKSHGQFRFSCKLFNQEELSALERMIGSSLPKGLLLAWGNLTIKTPGGEDASSQDMGAGMLKGGGAISQESVEQGIKGAITDSFKRCATYFGVALDLYSPGIYDNPEAKEREEKEREDLLTRLEEIVSTLYPERKAEIMNRCKALSLEELREQVTKGEEKLKEGEKRNE
jgi:hypothetical protein